MLFEGWQGPLRIAITGSLAYVGLIVILRLSGKRTLAKLNAFDFLVTVALGSSLATVMLSATTPLVAGLGGLCLLVALQFVISWGALRWRFLRRWIKSEPVLLLKDGAFLDAQMKRERVSRDDVLSAIRRASIADVCDVLAVVLESDGAFSVLPAGRASGPKASALAGVKGA